MNDLRAPQDQHKPNWPLWFWLLLVGAPVVFLGLMHYLENRSGLREPWHVTHAEYLPVNTPTPPPFNSDASRSDANWQKIEMPRKTLGDWREPTAGWFRLALPKIDTPDDVANRSTDWMIVIPKPNNANFSLWISGVRFAAAGSHDQSITSMPSNPITMEFPQLALKENDRHIYLRVTNELGGINPNRFYLGPSEALRGYSKHVTFVTQTLIRAILEMMAIMAVVVFFLHLVRRKQTSIYGWYTLGIAVWFLHTLHAQHENAAFGSVWFWYRTTYLTLAAYVLSAMVFINRLIDRPQPRLELGLLLLFLAGSVFILVDPVGIENIERFNAWLWVPAIIAVGVYMLIRLALGARRAPTTHTLILLAFTFLGVCVGIRDYLYNNLQLIPGGMLYLRHAAGLILVAFSFVMIRRFALGAQGTNADDLPASTPDPQSSTSSQSTLLQQEHDDLERQLKRAVLNTDASEGTAQFNSNMRAARHDLQLIRDMIDSDADTPAGDLLEKMQVRLSRSARRQRVKLSWEIPLVLEEAFLKDHYELALARFVQTATLEALAFDTVEEVQVLSVSRPGDQAGERAEIMQVRVHALLARETDKARSAQVSPEVPAPPLRGEVFNKRAQLEAAAKALGGTLNFVNVPANPAAHNTRYTVELEWQALR